MTEIMTSFASDLADTEILNQASNLPKAPLSVDASQVPLVGGTDPAYGEVRWRTLINGSVDTPRDMVLGIAEFEAGGRLLPHRHAPAEFYFGIEGSGTVTIDGEAHHISPGIAIYVPGNAEHGTVAGPDGLRFAYGFPNGQFEDIEYHFSAQG